MYEGALPGMSDIGVTLPILAFFMWLYYHRKQVTSPSIEVLKSKLRFIFLCGLFAPFVTVQSLKWLVSRARPKIFISEVLPTLTETHEHLFLPGFMGFTGPRGYSWNSFPSGHASTCALLLVLAYVFGNNKMQKSGIFLLVFALTGFMAVGRSMAGMHWISDSVASFFVVWAIIDLIYLRWNFKSKMTFSV
jgi:membrane-associated phospholipid phosphatase